MNLIGKLISAYHRRAYTRAMERDEAKRKSDESVEHFRTITALPEAPEIARLRELYKTRED